MNIKRQLNLALVILGNAFLASNLFAGANIKFHNVDKIHEKNVNLIIKINGQTHGEPTEIAPRENKNIVVSNEKLNLEDNKIEFFVKSKRYNSEDISEEPLLLWEECEKLELHLVSSDETKEFEYFIYDTIDQSVATYNPENNPENL